MAYRMALLLGAIALIALRSVHLGADTPITIGTGSLGLFVDEGYKTLDARNLVERGETRWNSADGYTGWADTSPLGHAGFLVAFRAFGPSLESARAVTLAWTALFLVGWIVAARGAPVGWALLGLALLGLQHTTFFFSRIALLELPMMVCLYAALWPMVGGTRSLRRAGLWVVGCALIAGFGLKPSALLYFVPVVAGLIVAAGCRHGRITRTAIGPALAVIVGLLAWAALNRDAFEGKVAMPGVADLRLVVLNPLSFASGPLLAAGLLMVAWALRRAPCAFFADPYRASLAAIAVLGPLLFAPFPYAPLRYHVPLLPAFALLAIESWRFDAAAEPDDGTTRWTGVVALALTTWGLIYLGHTIDQQILRRLPIELFDPAVRSRSPIRLIFVAVPVALVAGLAVWRRLDRLGSRSVRWLVAALLGLALAQDLWTIGSFLHQPSYKAREIASAIDATLDRHLSPSASVAGDWAPLLTLGTGRPALYLAAPDNDPERLDELRPDAFLFSDTPAGHRAREVLTGGLDGLSLGPALYTSQYVGRDIVLYVVNEEGR